MNVVDPDLSIAFYTSLGHRADLWSGDATFRAHVLGAIRWALGLAD